jgi:Tfp pilus assembly protein PilF
MATAHANLGWVLLKVDRKDEAEREFAESIRLDPSFRAVLDQRLRDAKARQEK